MSDQAGRFLPYGRQSIDDGDMAAVEAVLRGTWLTTGPAVAAFEDAFAAKVAAPHAVAVANGTAALHLVAMALDLGPGDWAVVPTVTFLATANGNRYVGAEVAFADVDPATGLPTRETYEAAIARVPPGKLKAIYAVHLNGQCVDMDMVRDLADRHGAAVVEDACHAVGGFHLLADGTRAPVGSCARSDFAVFSLHAVKTITMGEGGVITCRDSAHADRLKRLRSHGMVRDPALFQIAPQALDSTGQPNPWYYEMPEPGFNYRATDFACALGQSQLARLDAFVAARARLVDRYRQRLPELAPFVGTVAQVPWCVPAWHLFVALCDFPALGLDRAALMRRLAERGVGTQVHYLPVHRQPYYRDRYGALPLPGADAYYDRCLSLPLFVGMDESDVDHVVDALAGIARAAGQAA